MQKSHLYFGFNIIVSFKNVMYRNSELGKHTVYCYRRRNKSDGSRARILF